MNKVTTNLRIADRDTWEIFKQDAKARYMSANALLNLLIEHHVEQVLRDRQQDDPQFL